MSSRSHEGAIPLARYNRRQFLGKAAKATAVIAGAGVAAIVLEATGQEAGVVETEAQRAARQKLKEARPEDFVQLKTGPKGADYFSVPSRESIVRGRLNPGEVVRGALAWPVAAQTGIKETFFTFSRAEGLVHVFFAHGDDFAEINKPTPIVK